jgi:hypothetical protein
METARQALEVAAPLLTGDAAAGVEVLLERRDHREELDGLSDHELLRRAAREALIAVCLLCMELEGQAAALVATKTSETGTLLAAIAAALKAATDGFARANCIRDNGG